MGSRGRIAVGFAGMVGMAATWFDSTIDRAVRDRLNDLKDTELVKGWECDVRRMPIDYTGPGFGGRLIESALPGTTWADPSKRCARSETVNFAGSAGQTASARTSALTGAKRLRHGARH